MKAKIYPLLHLKDEIITIPCSTFLFYVELICASLASGSSVIKNIPLNITSDLIEFSRQLGATIKISSDKMVVKGVNNHIDMKNSMFVTDSLKTIKQFLPIFASVSQPVGIKTTKENIESLKMHKEIIERFGCLYLEEDNRIRIEKELQPLDLSFEGKEDIINVVSYILVAPLLKGTSRIKLNVPVFYTSDYSTILKIMKKFSIKTKFEKVEDSILIEIPGNQRYRRCKIKTEMDSYIAASFGILANRYHQKIKIKGFTRHYFNDGRFFDYLNGREFIASKRCLSYVKKAENSLEKVEASIIRGGICIGTLLFLCKNREGLISKINENDLYQQNFINLFEEGFAKTNIQFAYENGDVIIHPESIDEKFQFDANNNTYVAVTISLLALISNAPITIKNTDSVIKNYPTLFSNLTKLGAKIEYIHD